MACRGVGHTARGREVPRELHLTDVRLPYLKSPRVEGSSLSLLSGVRRRGLLCIRPTRNPLAESVFERQFIESTSCISLPQLCSYREVTIERLTGHEHSPLQMHCETGRPRPFGSDLSNSANIYYTL
jgi:hypothetical protein